MRWKRNIKGIRWDEGKHAGCVSERKNREVKDGRDRTEE